LEQCVQVAAGSASRPTLEGSPAGQHDADDSRSEVFSDSKRSDQSEKGDGVHTEAPSAQAVEHRPERVRGPKGTGGHPGEVSGVAHSGKVEHPADSQPAGGENQQSERNVLQNGR
jgi:hypothetical protein